MKDYEARYGSFNSLNDQAEWYSAFDVKESDKLYLAPADRVRVW